MTHISGECAVCCGLRVRKHCVADKPVIRQHPSKRDLHFISSKMGRWLILLFNSCLLTFLREPLIFISIAVTSLFTAAKSSATENRYGYGAVTRPPKCQAVKEKIRAGVEHFCRVRINFKALLSEMAYCELMHFPLP